MTSVGSPYVNITGFEKTVLKHSDKNEANGIALHYYWSS